MKLIYILLKEYKYNMQKNKVKKETRMAYKPKSILDAKMSLQSSECDIVGIVLHNINNEFDKHIDENGNANFVHNEKYADKYHYTIMVSDYLDYVNPEIKNSKAVYKKMEKACNSLEGKGFDLWDSDNDKTHYTWFPTIKYHKESRSIRLKIDDDTKKLLIDAKTNNESITYFNLSYFMPLKSQYSKRIYIMLSSYSTTGVRYDVVDELRERLKVPKSYNYTMFKTRALEKAVEDINIYTDLNVSFEEEKRNTKGGEEVYRIKWQIHKKKKDTLMIAPTLEDELVDKYLVMIVEKIDFTDDEKEVIKKEIRSNDKLTAEQIEKIINCYKSSNADNKMGLLIDMIKNPDKYKMPQNKKATNSFDIDIKHGYNMEDIEKRFLAN